MPSILVVDDEPHVRMLVADVLVLEDYEVRLAENGLVAVQRLEAEQFDCVILDVMMPGMNGHQVLQHIRSNPRTATLPVVMLTAAADDEQAWQAWTEGVDYFLAKPFEPDALLRYLEYLFENGTTQAQDEGLLVL